MGWHCVQKLQSWGVCSSGTMEVVLLHTQRFRDHQEGWFRRHMCI